jgi:hypothetical protein
MAGSHKTDQWALIMFHFEEYSPKAYLIVNLSLAQLPSGGLIRALGRFAQNRQLN